MTEEQKAALSFAFALALLCQIAIFGVTVLAMRGCA
jgi:hypothetical protein